MTFSLFSQEGNWCHSNEKTFDFLNANQIGTESFYQALDHAARRDNNHEAKAAAITVPVVVHIIHDNGIGNISDEQIFSALEVLNIDYQRLNADTVNTRQNPNAPFKQVAAGMDIEFVLARIDPWGNCTNGIVRVNAPHLTYNAGEDCKYSFLGGSDAWPKDQYMNIWVVNTINSDGAAGTIAGYAYYPYGAANNDGYGILMDDDYMGTIGTAAGEDGRVLTHEMGHALGLPHIFDEGGGPDGCHTGDCYTEGDRSCDTPPQTEANWSCNQTYNSCIEIPVNDPFGIDVYDQIENYMSYNACQNMFSGDQVNIMSNNFDDISFLNNMRLPGNLAATGVLQPATFCKADFTTFKRVLCPGEEIEFTDYSFSNPVNWTWTVTPGVEGVDFVFTSGTTSSTSDPVIQFLTPGTYTIQLVAGDGVTSDTEQKQDYIRVISDQNSMPFLESFEPFTTMDASDYWIVNNPTGNGFEVVTDVARTGAHSARLQNHGQPDNSIDELIASPIDLSTLASGDQVTLTFRYAYRKRLASDEEWLKVFISSDCGNTWVQRKTIFGDQLSTQTVYTPWEPSSESDWITVHMTNITQSFWVSNFRYKFRFESDGGNNFYLDDINLYKGSPSDELLGLEEFISSDGWNAYPNPVKDQLTIEVNAPAAGSLTFVLRDVQGREIRNITVYAQQGLNLVSMDMADLSIGVYVLSLAGSNDEVKRIIK